MLTCHHGHAALSLSLVRFSRRSAIACFASCGLCRRLCCRVISYSIPDDTMRITGSCGIRLAYPSCLLGAVSFVLRTMRAVLVPPLVSSGGSPLVPACLMSPPYASTLRPHPSSHRFISSLMLGCVPLSACLSSASPRHRYLFRCRCRPMASRLPPRLIDTTSGEIQ